jgi:DNA-binding transcriptional ArsR family regulator
MTMISQDDTDAGTLAVLPESVPVEMPDLPNYLIVNTHQQFRAFGEPIRERILRIIQNSPATAKQIADNLKVPPGTVGHHLQVLEEAGLAKIVARRLVRGIVAKYYTRTARIFTFAFPSEVRGEQSSSVNILFLAHEELKESIETMGEEASSMCSAFPHVRLSPERAKVYQERLSALLDDLLAETPDPNGQVYGLVFSLFLAPAYAQNTKTSPVPETPQEPTE